MSSGLLVSICTRLLSKTSKLLEVHPDTEQSPRPSSGGPPTVYLLYFALLTRMTRGLLVRLLEEEQQCVDERDRCM